MQKVLAIVSLVVLGGASAHVCLADAQSVRQVSQTQTTSAPAPADKARQDWFAHAVEDILTGSGAPASQGEPAQGRSSSEH